MGSEGHMGIEGGRGPVGLQGHNGPEGREGHAGAPPLPPGLRGLAAPTTLETTLGRIDGFFSQFQRKMLPPRGSILWEIDLRFAPGLPSGWCTQPRDARSLHKPRRTHFDAS